MEFELKDIVKLADESCEKPVEHVDPFLDEKWNSNDYKRFPYYRFFYQLTKIYKPRFVVELGGWQGISASHFAAGNKNSCVMTIDHHTDPGDDKHQIIMNECTRRYSNLKYLQGWTIDEVAEEQAGKHALGDSPSVFGLVKGAEAAVYNNAGYCHYSVEKDGIDILFIDSWHQADYAQKDWEAYKPLLASPALVICDDIYGGDCATISGMKGFWDGLPGEKFLHGQLHNGYPVGLVKI